MKIFSYDIWDGDKGIIFAQNEEEAEKKFKDMYPDTEIATDSYEPGECLIYYICDYNGEEKLVYLYN
jgi:hypothetical protein